MSDIVSSWSPGQAMLPPDPGGLNRALDRVAAEHLREVAPGLAPDASGYPFLSDERPPAPAPPAEATRESVETTIRNEVRRHPVGGYDYVHVERAAATGEMSREEVVGFLSAVQDASIDADPRWLDNGVAAVLANDRALRARAREAEERAGKLRDSLVDEHRTLERVIRERDEAREQLVKEVAEQERAIKRTMDACNALRSDLSAANARAEEAERKYDRLRDISLCRRQFPDGVVPGGTEECARGWHDWYEKENAARLRAEAERDGALTEANDLRLRVERLVEGAAKLTERAEEAEEELRLADFRVKSAESRSDDFAARLAAAEAEVKRRDDVVDEHASDSARAGLERDRAEHRLKLATEEIVRVRLAYDDPSLDGTDGAHPAWWRGSDAGVAGAVRIVNEALDEPLPLAGCVGGANLERVRQRIAALRERAERLVEAGDVLRNLARRFRSTVYGPEEIDRAIAEWAAAKGTK